MFRRTDPLLDKSTTLFRTSGTRGFPNAVENGFEF
jgi:hypothetical protein